MGNVAFMDDYVGELARYMEENGLSLADVSSIANVSKSMVSQILNGKYPNANSAASGILEKLNARLKVEFETQAQTAMKKILEWTKEDKQMALVVGESGMGKSFAINNFSALNKGVFVYRPTELSSAGGMLRELGLKLGIKVYGTNEAKLNRILDAIRKYELVIVDEADVLCESRQWASTVKKLAIFRQIMEAGVGVCLVGLPVLADTIYQMPGYFQNRIGYFLEFKLKKSEMIEFIKSKSPDMDDKWIEFAISNAEGGGYLRYLGMFCEKSKFLGYEVASEIIFTSRRAL